MNIAILHYHLNRGGVTRVIQNQLLALEAVLKPENALRVAVIYGGRRLGWPDDLSERLRSIRLSFHRVPALDYDEEQARAASPSKALEEHLLEVLGEIEFSPHESVVHVHNHAVGKTAALPRAASLLAERGYAMLLQIHDFMEDFRPAGFRKFSQQMAGGAPLATWHGQLYPQAPHVHYAVLNGRDHGILRSAGVGRDRLHLVPNPVPILEGLPSREESRRRLADQFGVPAEARFVLYPVRCIRRKNLGEALLYSKLAPAGSVVGLTLPPLNPAEKPAYHEWKRLSAQLELPCRFELGVEGGLGLTESLAACDLVLTTSVAEGFGMVFLESWLAGQVLAGRDLPEITADFRRVGICLDRLERQLRIPVEWVGVDAFRRAVLDAYRRTLAAFDQPQPPDLADGLDAKTGDGLVDFADLSEPLQEQVIRRVCHSNADRRRILDANKRIEAAFAIGREGDCELIRRNREAIARNYSLLPSGRRLSKLYERAGSSPRGSQPKPLADAHRILDRFLDFQRFRLLRSDVVPAAPDASGR